MRDHAATALVIGGSRGIGRAIVRKLAERGFRVVFTFNAAAEAAADLTAEVEQRGGDAQAVRCDLARMSDIEDLLARFDAGGARLGVVVNCGAVWQVDPLANLTAAGFDHTIDVNLKGPLFLAKLAAPRLRDGGRIIFISSIAARTASPEYLVYAAAKAGLNAVAKGLAMLLGGRGITVNVISPGLTATAMAEDMLHGAAPEVLAGILAMTALGRIGQPLDIAGAVGLLTDPDAGWITGQIIECTGGLML